MRPKNKILLLITTICLCVFSPAHASITGNRMIADELVGAMSAVEPAFMLSCEFFYMIDEAIALQARAYGEFDCRDELKIRQLLLALEARFNAFIGNISTEQWCELDALVGRSIKLLRVMRDELAQLQIVVDEKCTQDSQDDDLIEELIVERFERKFKKITRKLRQHFRDLQSTPEPCFQQPVMAVASSGTPRRNTLLAMSNHVSGIETTFDKLSLLRERDENNNLKCGSNLWCELGDWVYELWLTIDLVINIDLLPALAILDAKCPDVTSSLNSLTQRGVSDLPAVMDELGEKMSAIAR